MMTAISLGEAIDQARQLLHEQGQESDSNPERTAAICRKILGRYPSMPLAHRLLGLSLRRLGDPAGAEQAFGDALQSDPRDATALWGLSLLAGERGDQEAALAYVQAAWEIDPWRREWRERVVSLSQAIYAPEGRLQLTRAALASIYYRAGLWERAVDECATVLTDLGERLDLQLLMAAAACRERRFEWAAASSRDVLDRAPNAVDALLLLAEIERQQGNLSEAGWLRERTFAVDPTPERIAALLGFAGDESLAFFQAPEALMDLSDETLEPEAVIASPVGVEVADQTEDRLIALEILSSPGDIPELVELPQMPNWAEAPRGDREVEPAVVEPAVVEPAEPVEPELDQPEDTAAEAELEIEFEPPPDATDVELAELEDDSIAWPPLDEVLDQSEATEPDIDTEAVDSLETTEPEEAFAPWIPPAMAPPERLPFEKPLRVDDLPEPQGDDVSVDALVENGPDLQTEEEILSQPEGTVPLVQAVTDESPAGEPDAELERLRQRYRETPDRAQEIAADLEELIGRVPNTPIAPAAHRLLGSIYRKQGKAALASLHYRQSLAANQRRGEAE